MAQATQHTATVVKFPDKRKAVAKEKRPLSLDAQIAELEWERADKLRKAEILDQAIAILREQELQL